MHLCKLYISLNENHNHHKGGGETIMSGNEDRKIWHAEDVIFLTPKTPPSEEGKKKAAKFFDKFKPDIVENKAAASSSE